jgi:transposase
MIAAIVALSGRISRRSEPALRPTWSPIFVFSADRVAKFQSFAESAPGRRVAGLDWAMIVTKLHLDEEVARLAPLRQAQVWQGRSAQRLEMKTIPEPRTRCTKTTSQEALTRAEARRRQQQLESGQSNRPEPHPHFSIKDRHGRVAM